MSRVHYLEGDYEQLVINETDFLGVEVLPGRMR